MSCGHEQVDRPITAAWPIELVNDGHWELAGGTGQFESMRGVGTMSIEFVNDTDRRYVLEGDVSPAPCSVRFKDESITNGCRDSLMPASDQNPIRCRSHATSAGTAVMAMPTNRYASPATSR